MTRRDPDPPHTPLRPADLFVLLVLSERDLHGYGIMKAVLHLSDGAVRVDIGSLYRLLARLIEAGLIDQGAGSAEPGLDDDRRRYYRIAPRGRRVLKAELARLKSVVGLAAARRLLDDRSKVR